MSDHTLCEVCGNEIERLASLCPFCGSSKTYEPLEKQVPQQRVVNLENGMPTVQEALTRLRNEVKTAPQQGHRLLYLIHGYGSSGQGGAIRKEVRRQLQYMLDNGEVNDFFPGEQCGSRSGHWRQLVRRFPVLDSYGKSNPGVTVVIL